MIDFINEIPPLIAGAILGSGLSLLAAALVQSYGRSYFSEDVGVGFYLLSAALLIIGTPIAALLSGISLGEILALVMGVLFFGGLAAVAIVAFGIVLFILGSVFFPVR